MAEYHVDFQKTIEDAFLLYAGYTILNRAIPDARDALKYGARQGLYSQFYEGITHDKPYKKAQKSVAAGTSLCYVHGDVSLYDTLIRMGKPFAFRYPLQDIQGNFGNPIRSDNHAASRYVEMRQSELAGYLFEGLKKNAVEKWVLNYDDTENIPSVLPSPFFYNIVNGATGIGVGMATSIPTFNLREVNKALATLVLNPDATFEEVYCPIDFPTGATIINEGQVRESLRDGRGKSAIVRATLEYNARKHQIVVTQMPYMVYTETVCAEIGELLEQDPTIGIERVLDATTETPRIEITLSKKTDVESMKSWLYANTSLQSYFQINLTMLDMGKKPKVFGWREALLAHVDHMAIAKRREYEFDLEKAKNRLHIVKGLLIALEHIDEFITIIKDSESVAQASEAIRKTYGLSDTQTKAIMDIRLARLVNLEYVKVQKEATDLANTIEDIADLLNNQVRFNQMLVSGLEAVAKKFGDARRTTNTNIGRELEDKKLEVTQENTNIIATITNSGSLFLQPSSPTSQKKSGFVTLDAKDYVLDRVYGSRSQSILFFTKSGVAYTVDLNRLELNKPYNLYSLLELSPKDRIALAIHSDAFAQVPFVVSVTRNGMIKKSAIREFVGKKKGGLAVMKLKEDDEIVAIRAIEKETDNVLLLTNAGYVVRFSQTELSDTGRMTQGVKGIRLGANDAVADMLVAKDGQEHSFLLTITQQGEMKKTAMAEILTTGRYVKGSVVHKLSGSDKVALGTISAGAMSLIVGAANSSTRVQNSSFVLSGRGEKGKEKLTIQTGAEINYLAEVHTNG